MYRADRLAILGELATGAAHEIRNPLTSIRSSIQFLKKKLKLRSDIEIADDLISEVDRINEIIEGLLSFAKPQEPRKENANLKVLLNQSVQLVSNMALKNGVTVSLIIMPVMKGCSRFCTVETSVLGLLMNAI
jgi:nitrogen-specific signal transduction histidine kinase